MSKPWFKKNYKRVSKYKGDDPSDVNNLPNYGYLGFRLYFPDADHINEEMLKKHVNTFKTFFQQNQTCYSLPEIAKDKLFNLDFKQITGDENILTNWPEFKEELSNDSEYCLNCISLAMHDLITKYYEEQNEQNLILFEPITARICNVEPFLHLRELRFQYIGKLVTIKGTVIKTSDVKLIAQYLTFTCSNCFGTQISKQPDNVYTVPLSCKTKDCKAKTNFSVELASPYDKFVSWQSVKIQEPHWADQYDHARTPRTLDCELTEDLVNTCFPGDDVTISGIINVRDVNSNNGKNKQNSIFNLYLKAISVFNNKKQCKGEYNIGISFNQNDYFDIQKIHCAQNSFALLVQSLCPNIYGHEMVKAGLLLALFGGTKSESFRGESHVLVVGDPGLGKSQMLQACTNVAPRGVYVCGNTSTSSGLTVTMTRDGEGEFSLEAGALMLADQGCCCIDEFDKMPTQHAALLEAMEQQTISIAKAGTICSIPTRVTMLAAANPVGGHYNKARTIAENLKMNSPMLSRFDLIFILVDTVNEETDWLLSKHVVSIHLEQSEKSRIQNNSVSIVESSNGNLRDRLKFDASKADLVPHNLFRKYIAYAQKYVKPQLSDDAKSVIKQYYLSLRKQFQTGDCTPVTTRQANSLIRLTQARAKAELREVATKQDAEDVVEIMKWSLNDIFSDGTGVLDKTRSQNGTGTSIKAQITRLLRIVQRISEIETRSIFGTNELKQLSEQAGIAKNKFNTVLENLNLQGFLLKKGQGKYQLVTADF
ncbi:DNA helicase MCM8-like isoform X1 [Diorhabda sublineata]|uniref:DNA helicase MCM8-like isoform X1 n=1 Tax=Diorhabda sublineata TaxID=1163346 RepID=UPI0024E094D1|nr:DNA helicase MCM8-like isoform X1 [Diorhabda sublineata]